MPGPLNWTPTNRFIIKISPSSFIFTARTRRHFTTSTSSRSLTRRSRCTKRPSGSTRTIFRSRPITRKAITASARCAPTTRWWRGRTRSRPPTTMPNAKAFIIHLARVKIAAGRFDEARAQLDAVTNAIYADLKERLRTQSRRTRKRRDQPGPPPAFPQMFQVSRPTTLSRRLMPRQPPVMPFHGKTRPPLILTNGVPALTNPPVFSPKIVTPLTNVPPVPPRPSESVAALRSPANSTFAPTALC